MHRYLLTTENSKIRLETVCGIDHWLGYEYYYYQSSNVFYQKVIDEQKIENCYLTCNDVKVKIEPEQINKNLFCVRFQRYLLKDKTNLLIFENPSNIHCIESDHLIDGLIPNKCNTIYKLFNRKISICGSPSSGKTVMAKQISNYIELNHGINSFYVSEYATDFIQNYKKAPTITDQLCFLELQHDREKNAGTSNIVISDSPVFLSYIHAQLLTKELTTSSAFYLSHIYNKVLLYTTEYDSIVFLKLIKYVNNNVRHSGDGGFDRSVELQNRIRSFLINNSVNFIDADYNMTIAEIVSKIFQIN